MKLTCILILGCFLQVQARSYGQITLSVKNAPLERVFKSIRKQTGYAFFFDYSLISRAAPVSFSVKNAPLEEVLADCFKNQPFSYEVVNKNIFLKIIPSSNAPSGETAQPPPPIVIHGKVVGDKGEPVAGATISIKGSDKGATTTGDDGSFTLTVPSRSSVLVISSVGFRRKEIVAGTGTGFIVQLEVYVNDLNDIVVVGYGAQKKVNVLGAVSVVKAEELVVTKNENVVNMLAGKVPGMRIQQMSSEPGSFNTQFDIRGFGSAINDAAGSPPPGNPTPPLIIIDGVPRSSGDLARMDPSEIDNVSVLKDASAAIYGVKAANGVILVTSKRGSRNGKFNITYSVNQSWQQFLDVPNPVNAVQYMQLWNENTQRNFGTNVNGSAPKAYSDSTIALYTSGKLPSTNWMKAITRPLAPETQHNLNMSGGNDKVNYFFDLGYLTQGSLFKTNSINYDRWNFRSNVNINFTKRIRGAALVSGYTDTKNAPNSAVWTIFKYAENLVPTDQPYANNNPKYPSLEPDNSNPVVMTNSDIVGQNVLKNKNFQGQLNMEYDIPGIPGLMARAMYNYGYSNADNTIVNKSFDLYTYDQGTQTYSPTLVHSPSTVQRQYSANTNTLMQLSLNYKRQFGGVHNVTALALYEEGYNTGDNFSAQESFTLGIPYLFAGSTDPNYLAVGQNGRALINQVTKSVVGRFDYDYKGRYLAEFSFREDGSSNFSPIKRWGFFPAALVGWRISSEPFMQALVSPAVLDNLKIRASYGVLGDDQAQQLQWVDGYNYPGPGAVINGAYVAGVNTLGIPDLTLTWMQSKTLDIGTDFDLWNGLIGGSFDYFRRDRTGIPATPTAQVPGTSGLVVNQANLNGDHTYGVELVLTHHHTIRRVTYNVSANMSISRIKHDYFEQTRANSEYDQYKNSLAGRYSNIWWGYLYGGQYTSYGQIYGQNVNTGGGNQSVLPGDYYYQDINHDGVIDAKDQVPIATRDLPIINFGLTLGASWNNFDISVLLQGATDYNVQFAEQLASPLQYGRSSLLEFMNRWHTADPNANMFDPNTTWVPGNYPTTGSPAADGSKAVQNATYMRIKTLEIGYSLSKKLLSGIGIQGVRVYVNSYNLATLTGLKYSDPEHPGQVNNNQDWNISQGGYFYPLNRTFSAGASVSF
jgi:TonB-linked SusC/RagA family outer membrane protein